MSRTPPAGTASAREGAASGVRRRDVLGVPIAMVDYEHAIGQYLLERRGAQRP